MGRPSPCSVADRRIFLVEPAVANRGPNRVNRIGSERAGGSDPSPEVDLFAGGIARTAISRFHLDRAGGRLASVLRFSQAPWYYLLTASDLSEEEQPDLILASAIVEVGKEAFLYSGVVEHYYVSEDGELDRLVPSGASRRPISADKESPSQSREDRFYSIDGDFFVLRFSEAVTLNIQYARLQEVPAMTPIADTASPETQALTG